MKNSEVAFRDHFSAIVSGSGGVERLRKLVLELAFSGKLVPQLSSDQSDSSSGVASTGPFPLPSGWRWTTLKKCTKTWKQKIPDRPFTYIDVASIDNVRGRVGSDLKIIEPSDAPSRARKIVRKGTVIFSTVRPYLKNVAVIEREYQPEPIVSTAFSVLHPLETISNQFLFHYLRSSPLMEYVSAEMTGMAYPAITDRKLLEAPIPLPPLEEQHQIVDKVDRLLALCDDLESRQKSEREGRRRLRTASLTALEEAATAEEAERAWAHFAGEFGRLVDTVEDVEELRRTVMQIAVLGGFSRGDKGATVVNSPPEKRDGGNESWRNFPSGWKWIRLQEVCTSIADGDHLPPPKSTEGIPFIVISNISSGRIHLHNTFHVPPEYYQQITDSRKPRRGDILYTVTGASYGLPVLVESDDEFCFQRHIALLKPDSTILSRFLWIVLKSNLGYQQATSATTGIAQPTIPLRALRKFIIPLPPLTEQHRIVEKMDHLMRLCDNIEAGIRARDAALEAFATAACRAVLEGPAPVATAPTVPAGVSGQQRLPV